MATITMYCTAVCPYCVRAEMLLKQRGVTQVEKIRIDTQPEQREQIVVLIAGKLPGEEKLAQVAALGMLDQVVFTGLLDDVQPFLAALDVGFVLSSRLETISFACREMMAAGKPVIVTQMGGLTENVTEGRNGWIVPPESAESVARTLSEILKNRGVLNAMGVDARGTALKEFSLATFVGNTERVYRENAYVSSGSPSGSTCLHASGRRLR